MDFSPVVLLGRSLGVAAAYIYSLFAVFLPGLFPEQYRTGDGVGTYFEASVVIVALVFFGQVLELFEGDEAAARDAAMAFRPT